jgi:hypothetical protein
MRPFRRFFAFSRAILFVCLFAPIAFIPKTCTAQSRVSLRLVSARGRQTASTAPADWDTAVRELVDRVAAIAAPPARIDLAVNNVSSLSPDDAATIGEWLRAELTKRHYRLTGAQALDANLIVTLSEGTDGYLIVAQVQRGASDNAEQVAMVSISRAAKKAERSGGVSLEQARVWDQPGAILDFALPPAAAGTTPEMIVLERGRLAFYSRLQDQWQLGQAVTITPTRSWLRTEQGHIDISQGLAMGSAGLPGIECKGDFTNPQTIHCGFVSQDTQAWIRGDASIPKDLDIGGDVASVGLQCDGRPVMLATGKGDWTQPDFVQAYEMDAAGHAATLTGNPIEFAGPVTSLWATGASGAARAVVHNLKTGEYEAYLVTASCAR